MIIWDERSSYINIMNKVDIIAEDYIEYGAISRRATNMCGLSN